MKKCILALIFVFGFTMANAAVKDFTCKSEKEIYLHSDDVKATVSVVLTAVESFTLYNHNTFVKPDVSYAVPSERTVQRLSAIYVEDLYDTPFVKKTPTEVLPRINI